MQGNEKEHEDYSQARSKYEGSRGTRLGWNPLFLFFVFLAFVFSGFSSKQPQ